MAGADPGTETSHTIFRVLEVLTLIPAWAMMAAIVAAYNDHTLKTPGGIICLFVTTLLASIWAFCILITTMRAKNTALWIAFWDIVAMGILIAGVATTANTANTCSAVSTTIVVDSNGQTVSTNTTSRNGGDVVTNNSQDCGLLKAAWGLAIANIIFFVITAALAIVIYQKNKEIIDEPPVPVVTEKIYREPRPRRHHHHHRSHRSRPRTSERVYVERV